MRVAQHSYSSSVDCCYSDPVLSPLFESRDVQAVLATVHGPVLELLLLRLHTPHLESSSLAPRKSWFSLKFPLSMHFYRQAVFQGIIFKTWLFSSQHQRWEAMKYTYFVFKLDFEGTGICTFVLLESIFIFLTTFYFYFLHLYFLLLTLEKCLLLFYLKVIKIDKLLK